MPWSYIFFVLHKHCGLNKHEIMGYTLPQITELMKESNKYIQFEVTSRMPQMSMLGAQAGGAIDDDGFHEATEEDINELTRFLGG